MGNRISMILIVLPHRDSLLRRRELERLEERFGLLGRHLRPGPHDHHLVNTPSHEVEAALEEPVLRPIADRELGLELTSGIPAEVDSFLARQLAPGESDDAVAGAVEELLRVLSG